ncbi:hypothetical protein GQX74_010731 [Glossina fuscipes]|nr:hypothetical protein GQX74_010731 [Glossina fuscipes]
MEIAVASGKTSTKIFADSNKSSSSSLMSLLSSRPCSSLSWSWESLSVIKSKLCNACQFIDSIVSFVSAVVCVGIVASSAFAVISDYIILTFTISLGSLGTESSDLEISSDIGDEPYNYYGTCDLVRRKNPKKKPRVDER